MLSNVLQKGLYFNQEKKIGDSTINKSLSFHEDVKEILQIAASPVKEEKVKVDEPRICKVNSLNSNII